MSQPQCIICSIIVVTSLFILNTIPSWVNTIQRWVLKYKMITSPLYFSWSEYLYSLSVCLVLHVSAINSSPNSHLKCQIPLNTLSPSRYSLSFIFWELCLLGPLVLLWSGQLRGPLSFWYFPSPSSGDPSPCSCVRFLLDFIASSLREKRYTFSPPKKRYTGGKLFENLCV